MRIDGRIGINEKESFAAGGASTGIAGGGDLAVIYIEDAGGVQEGDVGCGVGGSIIDHNDFVRQGEVADAGVNCVQCAGKKGLFVMGGNDERDHSGTGQERTGFVLEKMSAGLQSVHVCAMKQS